MLLLRSLLRPALRARPDAPAPIGLLRAARLTGAVYGTLQLAALFAGFVITVQAEEIGSSDDLVQLIVGLSSAASALVAVCWFLRRTAMPPGWRLAVPVVALGVALVYLGLWPSVGSFTVALVLASGLGPSAMLVRQRIAGQFPGRCQGAFLATCQTWTFLVRALGGLAFALAVYGVLDLPWATVALGGAVLAVAAVYAWWPRLRGHAGRSPDPGRASAPTPLARLLGSPSLRRGLVATVGIYTAFGVFWAELQPRIAGVEGFDDRGAAVVTALLGLTVVASIPRVRRHSRLSDQDSTRSATEASGILLLASAVGILSLIPCVDAALVLLPLFLIYIAGIEIGGNATSSAVTTALTVMDSRGRATLMASLARSLAGVICGAITAVVA